jgi:hypothetical protein
MEAAQIFGRMLEKGAVYENAEAAYYRFFIDRNAISFWL